MKITIYIAASIDGYIARSDDSLDWMDCVGGYDEDYGFQKMLSSIDAVIMGRKTYKIASSVQEWPYIGKRVIVLSRSLAEVRNDAELYQGDIKMVISQLHRDGVKHIWIDGGVTISQFLSSGLVDTMIISIIPVILGNGVPLFNRIGKEIPCRLKLCQSYPSGLAQLQYEVHDVDSMIAKGTLFNQVGTPF